MARSRIAEGDLFLVPGGGSTAPAHVEFCSSYFRRVILVKLYLTLRGAESVPPPPGAEFVLYYTSADSITRGGWERVGHLSVTEEDRALSRRIVGGEVWEEDRCLGPASEEDSAALPQMLTFDFRLIEKAVAEAAG